MQYLQLSPFHTILRQNTLLRFVGCTRFPCASLNRRLITSSHSGYPSTGNLNYRRIDWDSHGSSSVAGTCSPAHQFAFHIPISLLSTTHRAYVYYSIAHLRNVSKSPIAGCVALVEGGGSQSPRERVRRLEIWNFPSKKKNTDITFPCAHAVGASQRPRAPETVTVHSHPAISV